MEYWCLPGVYWRACGQDLWLVGVDPLHALCLAEFLGSELGTWAHCSPFLLCSIRKQIVLCWKLSVLYYGRFEFIGTTYCV